MKYFKAAKHRRISMLVVMVMLLQVLMPVVGEVVWAEEGEIEPVEVVEEPANEDDSGGTTDPEDAEDEEILEEDDETEDGENEEEVMEGELKELGNIFTSAKLTVNGEEINEDTIIEIKDNMEVKLEFDWELEDSVNLQAGDWAKIKIPNAFKGISGKMNGDLKFGDEVVGTYEITEDGYLKVVFNEKLVDKTERKGTVGFLLEFALKEFEDDATQIIKFEEPINKEFTITAKPGGETSLIYKSGGPDADINPEYINWVIDVNTSLEKLDNAIVEDIIPAGLELDFNSVEIYELKVGYGGKITEGSKIETLNPVETDKGFKVEIGETNKAYRIKYNTKIVDYPADGYNNKTILKDGETVKDDAEFKIDKITRGSLIEKSGWADKDINPEKITWQIDVNKAEQNLTNVSIEDSIPAGLSLKDSTMRVWKLVKDGSGWRYGEEITDSLKNEGKLKFPLELGDIETAYRITFDTDIEYDDEYKSSLDFENTATLKEEGEEVDYDKDEVTVNRDTLLEKNGTETTSYGNPEITWTIDVNKANHSIENAVITDTIGEGLKLREGSIKVDGKEVPLGGDSYPRLVEQEDNSFILELGNINSSYIITYVTDVTNPDLESYSNKVDLTGDGLTGDGIGNGTITKEPSVKPSVNNNYNKTRADKNKEIDGINYDGINYEEKTMSWLTTVDAKKELITELTITDTFEPAGSMVFMSESLRVLKNGELVDRSNYTLTDNKADGFVLKFKGPLDRTKYEIYYKTSFDPDKVIEAVGTLNTTNKYTNKANFTGKVKPINSEGKDIDTKDKTADYTLKEEIFNGGKKDGDLDRTGRTITWKIYVNALGQDLTGRDLVITDTLSEGQVFNRDSLVIKEYTLEAGGNIKVDEGSTFSPKEEDLEETENGFKLTFKDGIDKPYVIEYKTKVAGISKPEYTNIANIIGKDLEKNYEGKVTYNDHNKFIVKEASNIKGNTAYTDDEINWKVTLNESLSDIKNAVFKDTMSQGHVYVNGSLKVYKGSISEGNLVKLEDGNPKVTKTEGKTELELTLGDIDTVYIITYDTVVVATEGSITNDASLSGETLDSKGAEKKEFTVRQSSWGTGEGRDDRGSIVIYKVDGKTGVLIDAEFELYYFLNGEKQIVGGESRTTENGELKFVNLPFRTYHLREVKAPEGYKLNLESKKIVIGKCKNQAGPMVLFVNDDEYCGKDIVITVENYKLGSLSITKVDSKDKSKFLKGAEFRLINNETKETYKLVTDENGKAKIEGLPQGEYTLQETKAPLGYKANSEKRKIVIGECEVKQTPMMESDEEEEECKLELDLELTIENTKRPPAPSPSEGGLRIKKVDKDKPTKVLEGARFNVINSDGEVVATLTTDSKGIAQVDELPLGKYTIVEVKAPENYKLDSREYEITIEDDGKIVDITIENEEELEEPERPTRPSDPDPKDPYEPKDPKDPKDPEEPTKPTDPEKPKEEEPVDPEKPVDPTDPTEPTDPEDPTIGIDGDTPAGGTDTDKDDKDDPTIGLGGNTPKGGTGADKPTLPKTGENNNISFYFTGLILIGLGFVVRRKIA